jgi:hypothetical protein
VTRFIETSDFSKHRPRFLPGDAYTALQHELIADPKRGRVMPGCGGLRKLRISDRKRQKRRRGGARIIYLHIAEADEFVMVDVYGKGEKEDLTPAEKNEWRTLAREYKKRRIAATRAAVKGEEAQ